MKNSKKYSKSSAHIIRKDVLTYTYLCSYTGVPLIRYNISEFYAGIMHLYCSLWLNYYEIQISIVNKRGSILDNMIHLLRMLKSEVTDMIFDSHAHYDDEAFDEDRECLLEQMKENGISYIVNVGASLESTRNSIALAKKYEYIYAAAGVHPSDTG